MALVASRRAAATQEGDMSRTNHRRPRKKKQRRAAGARGARRGAALYRCHGCGHRWYQAPGMVECPLCHDYHVEWLNYDELEQSGAFREREDLLGY